ncbi:MAG: TlpA disulfide reductase family protein [Bacteroides sp.]
MKKIKFFLIGILLFCLGACDSTPHFNVEGKVTDANGTKIYLESLGIECIEVLDSAKLDAFGSFSFKQPRPESPEFYRLRMDNRIINFSIDSTETININADRNKFSTGYTVTGSENSSKIKELTLLQMGLQKQVDELINTFRNNNLNTAIFEDSIVNLIEKYKSDIRMNYIYVAPNKTYAYFALFQEVNDYLIFDPLNNKEDIKCFAAVATSLNNFYPHADRSKNLYNMVIKGMKNTRAPRQQALDASKINEAGVIEISLKNIKGNQKNLSELKGKVVLLDFTIYQSASSAAHNFALRDLYSKYANQGLEIYQVSLDADEHFWKTAADNLPWICVHDPNGTYSSNAALYNVKKLPTYFLINRNNELSARDETIKDLEAELKKIL